MSIVNILYGNCFDICCNLRGDLNFSLFELIQTYYKMGSRKNREDILARVNFPLYAVQMLTNRHVIVGGGGGSSKTGVANGFVGILRNYQ